MATPRVMVLKEHGTNCEMESVDAFEKAGAKARIVHMNDLIDNPKMLSRYQILMLPGGFSHGDDTGSGLAWANRIRGNIWDTVRKYIEGDRLALGICNGFQTLVNLGFFPTTNGQYGVRNSALIHNDSARYNCRWVDLKLAAKGPWFKGMNEKSYPFPIAHGEGKFYAGLETFLDMREKGMIAAKYTHGEICDYQSLVANPNGSLEDIAGITDDTGKVLGMMPHPERAFYFSQLLNAPYLMEKFKREGEKAPKHGPGYRIFKNAVEHFTR